MDVDGRCDGERDEYQRSESGNKPLRHCEGRCVARVLHNVEQFGVGVSWDKLRASDKPTPSTMQMVSLFCV